ncbi:MAG: PASTA domain-containing protein, partial [Gemmatimonadota bacterium]|nr:PASTA domain-containing protein [Gemmatimonadota bacterium]
MNIKFKTSLVYLVTAAVSFFFGLFVLDQVILPQLVGGQREIEVPDMEGVKLDLARIACEEKGLSLAVRGETYHEMVEARCVIKQDPEPGVTVKRGRQIFVVVSLGREIVEVPRVEGLTRRQATILIERSRLDVSKIITQSDEEVPAGRVIEVDPKGGTALASGGRVVLYVSEGARKVKVPSVIDKDLEEARESIEEAGLSLGNVSSKYSYIPEGRVIDQLPLEYTTV